ncbi:hypothetical protein LTR22_011372 [Elasticomyces elasticus]|nr:hypothetical protein LTR22_011372 [Elasticomyces elasticus]KAK4919624.1 hypothetical protein LTR49_012688 [Elasticomyces elasticus]KAK5751211.1 hypothetical protein LTS12_018685 [Elasticomyces elasticus]
MARNDDAPASQRGSKRGPGTVMSTTSLKCGAPGYARSIVAEEQRRRHSRKQRITGQLRASQLSDNACTTVAVAVVPPPKYSLTSATDRLSSEFVRCIDDFHMGIMPHVFATTLLGRAPLLDAAADVVIQIRRHSCPFTRTITNDISVLRSYTKALSLAQFAISSSTTRSTDETLAGVSLMTGVDWLLQAHNAPYTSSFTHWNGLVALLLARPPSAHRSLVVRANDSPFETHQWLQVGAPSLREETALLARLKKASNQIGVSLPRILRLVRESLASADVEKWNTASRLANELMLLEDEEAESWLLHRVRVVPTGSTEDKIIIPFSYEFSCLEELDAAVYYWQVLLVLLRLRGVLYAHDISSPKSARSHDHPTVEGQRTELGGSQLRLCTNIMMAWQQAMAHAPCGTMSFPTAHVAMWAVLRHQRYYGKVPRDVVGAWLCKAYGKSWRDTARPHITMTEFDSMSTVLDGGPLSAVLLPLMDAKRANAGSGTTRTAS